jgi:hypothetical protein
MNFWENGNAVVQFEMDTILLTKLDANSQHLYNY